MKTDEHCLFASGFDDQLKADYVDLIPADAPLLAGRRGLGDRGQPCGSARLSLSVLPGLVDPRARGLFRCRGLSGPHARASA